MNTTLQNTDVDQLNQLNFRRNAICATCCSSQISDDNEAELTAVLFVGHVTTVIVTVTFPATGNTATRVSTLKLIVTTR